ncbi:MAG: glycosyltransferase family 39 protein [bacterium]
MQIKKNILIFILCVFITISFVTLPRNPLQNDDASLYALAAKNAVVHGQWLAQFISPGDSSSFLDKPPLGIWLLAWLPKIFGVSELTIHFPNVIYYSFLLLIIYLAISYLSSRKLALYSTIIAATSLGLVVYSRAPKLDVLLTLFVMTANLAIYAYLKKDKPVFLYLFTLSIICGTLIKSGFGLIFPALTILFLLIFNPYARKKLFSALLSLHFILNILLFLLVTGGVLSSQSISLKDQWLPYLISISIQSKYNTSYLGFGFYYSIIGFLLLILFPWSPLWLTSLKNPLSRKSNRHTPHLSVGYQKLSLSSFCNLWFWSNVLFLLFFYRQNDLRTFTVFCPPLAILAGIRLALLIGKPATKRRGFLALLGWNSFLLFVFGAFTVALLFNPHNAEGFNLSSAIQPLSLFVLSLITMMIFFWQPTIKILTMTFFLVCLAYSLLFWNSQVLVNAFNPDVTWPKTIANYQAKGYKFYIYRPPDRQLFYSPDLFYVDFMAGPADQYFWDPIMLKDALKLNEAIVLSDTKSWRKLKMTGKTIAQDSYSCLILR